VTFKGGIRTSTNSNTCSSKNTLIFVTAYGGLNVTVPYSIGTGSRVLQSVSTLTNLTTSLTVSSVYWTGGMMGLNTYVVALFSMAIAVLSI